MREDPVRRLVGLTAIVTLFALASDAAAQRIGTLAEWKQRIFDPTSIGLDLFPGSSFNQKFTIDQIRLDESKQKMAVYVIPGDQMEAAATFYAKQLGRPIEASGLGTMGELRIIRVGPGEARDDKVGGKFDGLTIRVEHAQWATGKGQVWMLHDAVAGDG
jgi:hypothetical protein